MDSGNRRYARGLARAFGGAVLFAFPLTMTMEMWSLGFAMERERLLLFVLVDLVMLVGVSHFAGFEPTTGWAEDVLDAFAAFAVGFVTAAAMLALFAVISPGMSAEEIVGKVVLQTVPASLGAMLSRKQFGARETDSAEQRREAGYVGELFLMAVGALFIAFNVAPTEEMVLIAYKMTAWHAIALVLVSLALLHAFVYAVGFAGQESAPEGASFGTTLLHYSVAGYGVALAVSLYVLWTFGHTDGVSIREVAQMMAVVGFPAALGAALARLIV
jgi:putative integral membrane protein (TIGR02587 family)